MNIFYMAIKNLKKNFSFYSLYLLSVSFVITVFFAFTSFSVNKIMLEKISTDGRVESMCNVISIFLMAFVIFYMAYSNRFFLRRRTKELGIYALLGYRKFTILSLLTFENVLICSGAFITGLVLGALSHKGIVFGITALLNLSIDNSQIPFFNINAINKTIIFIALVVLVLAISNGKFLYKTSLVKLIRHEKSAEKKLKFRKIPAFMGFIMILSGYCLSLDILRGAKSVWVSIGFYQMGLITMIIIVIGTVLFINSFLPYIMQKSKKNKRTFYTDMKIIAIPNFIYRIRSNSKTLIMLTLLSATTLTVSSVMALSLYYPIASVSRIAPSEIEFRVEKNKQIEDVKQIVSQYTSNTDDIIFTQTNIYKVKSSSKDLPFEYEIGTSKNNLSNSSSSKEVISRESGFECISFSDYYTLLKAQNRTKLLKQLTPLRDNECILMKYQPNNDGYSENGTIYPLLINGKETPVAVRETSLNNAISFANSVGTLIVNDSIYEQIAQNKLPMTSILSINGKSIKNNENLYSNISDYLDGSPYLQGYSHRINDLLSINSSTFLLIGFLVVLFFIAVGSILYFNNISAISDSTSDYKILQKMGYDNIQIKKIIKKQVLPFFNIPFLLGILDCIFATLVYKTALMQNLLGNSFSQYIPVIIAIFLTSVVYLIYYILTIKSCCKIVLKN
ncbi:salivaricin lantibiotic ABC transporter permease [Clostridioides difficile]|uniref:Abc transporter, permease associated with salivaricin lantibiotic n=9 Tax=Clostridioides difficile TaxID=1496 RepID=A0A9R0BN20_CLODR|nr:FtsX-like permease family protein [Clostridioides difficile]OFU05078.1 ABC transporter permease [Clostridium sp. HMSC19D07]OFU05122.1 ABC transporter permease [Clostridium sp. HMSC19E03]OFU18926.1 ABC transporter permease [Clostridium sp. HMSC19C08]OFU20580.1 ABC transporter permease [Clostridium sp. HMSC19C09]OFU24613.1 ABC transporter permease [Clostridium sp. HMSC19C05]OFU29190.1 ABC transporter permease [Clostridium sp. HMSC19B10]OFU42687.1 ABC transporter permease [Clostridium sp. HM